VYFKQNIQPKKPEKNSKFFVNFTLIIIQIEIPHKDLRHLLKISIGKEVNVKKNQKYFSLILTESVQKRAAAQNMNINENIYLQKGNLFMYFSKGPSEEDHKK
jgi:hypothetical protein